MSTRVAIAIVGYNNISDIESCIRAIAKSTYTDFEVIVCENGSDHSFLVLQSKLSTPLAGGQRVTVIKAPFNNGYASGINQCVAATPSADAWWILNPDTEPAPAALAALVRRLELGDVQAVGGTLYFPDGRVQSHGGIWRSWFARAVSIGLGSALETVPDAAMIERVQSYLSGASMLVNREFVQRAGSMSEEFFLYCEEIDWCLTAARKGLRLGFAPGATVLHKQGTSTGRTTSLRTSSKLSIYLDERNKILVTRDHFPFRLPIAGIAALLLLALRYLRKGAIRQFGYGMSGWFAGLLGRRGIPRFDS
jgi:N-acetylglucosaminyl-diphospho-decaprenol L-rhamnosyltransferase